MKRLIGEFGKPDFNGVNDYFNALSKSIIYQQLSGKAARTIYNRFIGLFDNNLPQPEDVIKIDIPTLRSIGISQQKSNYISGLAEYFANDGSTIDFESLSDIEVGDELIQIKGIGQWTVDMFLMFTLYRTDILPVADLGIQKGIKILFNMKDFIDALESIPLSDKDLANIAKCLGKNLDTIRIMTYDKLHDFKNLHELFSNKVDSIYILLQRKDTTVGHWVLLMKNIYGYVYFDPYSFSLIESLEITENDNYLYQLLDSSDSAVDENEYKLQEFTQGISTCGRHVCVRSLFPILTNKEYYEKVILPPIENKQVKDSDVLINLLTAFLSNSDDVIKEFYNCIDCEDSNSTNQLIGTEEESDSIDMGEISLRRRYYI